MHHSTLVSVLSPSRVALTAKCMRECVFSLWRQTTFSVAQLSIHDKPTRGLTNKTAGTERLIKTHDCTPLVLQTSHPARQTCQRRQKQGCAKYVCLLVSKKTFMWQCSGRSMWCSRPKTHIYKYKWEPHLKFHISHMNVKHNQQLVVEKKRLIACFQFYRIP